MHLVALLPVPVVAVAALPGLQLSLGFFGLAYTLYPFIIPDRLTN